MKKISAPNCLKWLINTKTDGICNLRKIYNYRWLGRRISALRTAGFLKSEQKKWNCLHCTSTQQNYDLFIPFLTFLARFWIRIFLRIRTGQKHTDPDPKHCSEQDLKEVNRSPIDFFCKSTNLLLETHKIDSFFFLETN